MGPFEPYPKTPAASQSYLSNNPNSIILLSNLFPSIPFMLPYHSPNRPPINEGKKTSLPFLNSTPGGSVFREDKSTSPLFLNSTPGGSVSREFK